MAGRAGDRGQTCALDAIQGNYGDQFSASPPGQVNMIANPATNLMRRAASRYPKRRGGDAQVKEVLAQASTYACDRTACTKPRSLGQNDRSNRFCLPCTADEPTDRNSHRDGMVTTMQRSIDAPDFRVASRRRGGYGWCWTPATRAMHLPEGPRSWVIRRENMIAEARWRCTY